MTARRSGRRRVEERPAVSHCRPDRAVVREDSRHQCRDFADTRICQLTRISAQLAGVIAIDEFQCQRDVAAVLGERSRLRAVPDRQFGVLSTFSHGRQRPDRTDQCTSDGVEGVEVFDSRNFLPPLIPSTTQQSPVINHHFVHGVLDQTGKVSRCGKLGAIAIITTVQVHIPGHPQVELADTAQFMHIQVCQFRPTRRAQQVIHSRFQTIRTVEHAPHLIQPDHRRPASQRRNQLARLINRPGQVRRFKNPPGKLHPHMLHHRPRQLGSRQTSVEQVATHCQAHLTRRSSLGSQLRSLGLHITQLSDRTQIRLHFGHHVAPVTGNRLDGSFFYHIHRNLLAAFRRLKRKQSTHERTPAGWIENQIHGKYLCNTTDPLSIRRNSHICRETNPRLDIPIGQHLPAQSGHQRTRRPTHFERRHHGPGHLVKAGRMKNPAQVTHRPMIAPVVIHKTLSAIPQRQRIRQHRTVKRKTPVYRLTSRDQRHIEKTIRTRSALPSQNHPLFTRCVSGVYHIVICHCTALTAACLTAATDAPSEVTGLAPAAITGSSGPAALPAFRSSCTSTDSPANL